MAFKKVILITLDSLGVGELPDAAQFGDEGANTLDHIAEKLGSFSLPHLENLGVGLIPGIKHIRKVSNPIGFYGKCLEQSAGKDTTTGHWEIAGIISKKALPTFPHGFPPRLIERFKKEAKVQDILGNYPASGTVIIAELGKKHLETRYPIVYTSADSVFQIAAHDDVYPVPELYQLCEIARHVCNEWGIGRVIARPFVGKVGQFERTHLRRDFSLPPPKKTVLDYVQEKGLPVIAIGKTSYIFAEQGVTEAIHTKNNRHSMEVTIEQLKKLNSGLIFTNLVDFDMLYGHRRDVEGYGKALKEFDILLADLEACMDDETILMLSADHGCDPTAPGSDHTREYVPILVYTPAHTQGKSLGVRKSFSDIGKTIADIFEISAPISGSSFLPTIECHSRENGNPVFK